MGKNKENISKPKEFQVNAFLMSELSFIDTQERASYEIFEYWKSRHGQTQARIALSLGLDQNEYNIDFSTIYSSGGKVFATKKPKAKVVVEDAKPKLHKKQK